MSLVGLLLDHDGRVAVPEEVADPLFCRRLKVMAYPVSQRRR
jgi:hypothetical protein